MAAARNVQYLTRDQQWTSWRCRMTGAGSHGRPIRRVEMRISGSYRKAGRDYGETFGADIVRQLAAYEPVFDLLGMGRETVAQRALEHVLLATEHAFPDYIDELRGRAEGAGVAFRHLFSLSCIEEIWSWVGPEKMRELEELATPQNPMGHCTTFALRRGGRTLIGHNEDWSAVDLDTTMLVHLSLIHISEPTRLGMISYAVFCL